MNMQENNIKRINDYQFNLNDQVGKGFSSKVYKGSHISSKEVVAIKAINSKSLKTDV
jgi:serine/threonine protein kinase